MLELRECDGVTDWQLVCSKNCSSSYCGCTIVVVVVVVVVLL